jgi:hypothetical protein
VKVLASRQDVNGLEEFARRNAEDAQEPILNRPQHFAASGLAVLSLKDKNLCDRNSLSSFKAD